MAARSKPLLAGVASTDISPEMGIQLAGDIGRPRPTEEIRERLFARALVLSQGKTRCAIVVMDLCIFSTPLSDRLRSRIAEATGIPFEAIAVMATQTHGAPSLGHCALRDSCPLVPPEHDWLRGGDRRYEEPTLAKIIDAVGRAAAAMEPIAVSYGRAVDGRVAYNRRFIMRDGTRRCHPGLCDPNILQNEGPIDPEVGVLRLAKADGTPLSVLLHHTSHPCHSYPTRYTLADWPGVWADLVQQRLGGGLTPMVLNGCCGNIHHTNHLDPTMTKDHIRMATMLADSSDRALKAITPSESNELNFRRSVLKLPMRKVSAKELAAAKKIIREHPEPWWNDDTKSTVKWDWLYAASTIDLDRWVRDEVVFPYEIQAFRIGDAAIVTVMGEPFVEGQLAIKAGSPARFTIVGHMANGYAGYVPIDSAMEKGGTFETRVSAWSKFQPGALEAIQKRALKLLGELF